MGILYCCQSSPPGCILQDCQKWGGSWISSLGLWNLPVDNSSNNPTRTNGLLENISNWIKMICKEWLGILWRSTWTLLYFVWCGLMLVKLLMDSTKHDARVMVCHALEKPVSLMRRTPSVWIKGVPGFSILFQRLRTSWFLVKMSQMHLPRPSLLNKAIISCPTKISLNGGWIIRNVHQSLMAMSSLSYQLCKIILNLCIYGRNMLMLFYKNLVSPQLCTNPAYTPESSIANKLFSFNRSMILLLPHFGPQDSWHFTRHAGGTTHFYDQKTGLSWNVQWYWYHSNTRLHQDIVQNFHWQVLWETPCILDVLIPYGCCLPYPSPMQSKLVQEIQRCYKRPDSKKQANLATSMHLSYHSDVGEPIWGMTTCHPDLAHASVKLSQSNSCPCEHHYHMLCHALKYLCTTRDNGLYSWCTSLCLELKERPLPMVHSNKSDLMLDNHPEHDATMIHTCVDSDWATCVKTCHSFGGVYALSWWHHSMQNKIPTHCCQFCYWGGIYGRVWCWKNDPLCS